MKAVYQKLQLWKNKNNENSQRWNNVKSTKKIDKLKNFLIKLEISWNVNI